MGRWIKDGKAVSPVVGVMLMLVVTVVLAAVVSSYGSGISGDMKSKAPTATFKVRVARDVPSGMPGYVVSYVEIKQTGGDPIPTDQLKIVTINPDAYGSKKIMEVLPKSGNTHYYTNWGGWKNGTSPYLNDVSKGYFGNNPAVDFGNYTIASGLTMTADWYNNYPQAKWNATLGSYELNKAIDANAGNVTGFCAMFADCWNVTPGHFVTVKIVHTPTGSVIWQKDIMVEG
ncbi:type IV pilin [Archaeoglobus neptunius]|uniref:type IV pilin n=1 Tax=Archaeoglobus neptunius TaxID=2798580 RepID=UPI001927FEA1|nr:type IV pilin [Archaeoglobus neptunius]